MRATLAQVTYEVSEATEISINSYKSNHGLSGDILNE